MKVAKAPILVAAESTADADLVRKQLAVEFDSVKVSTVPEEAVRDFETFKPKVLVLAFPTLEQAERYYLGLYRLSKLMPMTPHRTVILCNKDQVHRVADLCKREHFDDYVLFWPMTHDAPRLAMAVLQALRLLAAFDGPLAATADLATQARRVAGLEAHLEQVTIHGGHHVDLASRSLHQVGEEIGAALNGFSHRVTDGDLRDQVGINNRRGFEREFERLRQEQIEPSLRSAAAAVAPVQHWVGTLQQELAPQLESARALGALAEHLPPLVLMVDDDEFQHKVMAQLLVDEKLELLFASTGIEALGLLRRRRPALILMDVDLPDIDGVEVTRRIKSVRAFANIPVAMITGHREKQLVIDSLNAGACDFVVKPFERETTVAKLRRMMSRDAVPQVE